MSNGQKWILAVVSLVVLLTLAAFHLQASQQLPFDHDEQHVSTGALLGRQGLLPYVDYPYMHAPYLAPVLAAVFSQSDELVSSARALNAACGAALVALIFFTVWGILQDLPFRLRLLLCAGVAVYMSLNSLFNHSSGRVDNHDLSMLLSFCAFLAHLRGMRLQRNTWFLLSGAALGLAAGFRLTVLPMGGAFLLTVLFPLEPRPWKARLQGAGLLASGAAAALLPMLVLMAVDVQRSFFYTFVFNPEYNKAYWLQEGGHYAIGILGKLAYLLGEVTWSPAFYRLLQALDGSWWGLVLMPFSLNGGLFIGLALLLYHRRLLAPRFAGPWPQLRRLTLWTLPFVLGAVLASTPSFYQYFYPLLPFSLIMISYGWAVMWREFSGRPQAGMVLRRTLTGIGLAALLLGGAGMTVMTAHWAGRSGPSPAEAAHLRGREIRSLVSKGKVLTLSPVFPLEGGLEIYPRLATGPFFYRVAHMIEPQRRKALNIIGPDELEDLLAHDPPAAILTGLARRHEEALLAYARRHGYRPHPLAGGGMLYLPGGRP